MTRKVEMEGRQFGRLTVLREDPVRKYEAQMVAWICRCECGIEKSVVGSSLRKGLTRSCGCLALEVSVESGRKSFTHGLTRRTGDPYPAVYGAFYAMKTRCYNPKSDSWEHYGARGITVCQEWLDSFEVFYAHVGDRPGPGYSLDRIDVNGNYEPGNVRWATASEQRRNQRPRVPRKFCTKGHLLDDENTYVAPNRSQRVCRTCRAEYDRKRREESHANQSDRPAKASYGSWPCSFRRARSHGQRQDAPCQIVDVPIHVRRQVPARPDQFSIRRGRKGLGPPGWWSESVRGAY